MPITQVDNHIFDSEAGELTKKIGVAFQKHLDAYLSSVTV